MYIIYLCSEDDPSLKISTITLNIIYSILSNSSAIKLPFDLLHQEQKNNEGKRSAIK